MFWLINKKNNFQLRTLIWGPEYMYSAIFGSIGMESVILLRPKARQKEKREDFIG